MPRPSSDSPRSAPGLALFALLTLGIAASPIGSFPLQAQQPQEATGDTLERTQIATLSVGPGQVDSLVIVLTKRVRYGAELQSGATFSLVPVRHRKRAAFIVPLPTTDARKKWFEVYPQESGQHVLRIEATPGRAVSLSLWSDARATREAIAAARAEEDRTWSIGVMAGLGQYGGYFVEPVETGNPEGGTDFEIGVLVGSGGVLSGTFGLTHQGRDGYSMNWLFIEPRVRVKSFPLIGGRNTDLGISLRLGQANASDRQVDPSMVAPGVFLTQHLDSGRGARGITLTLGYAYWALGNLPRDTNVDHHRVSLGLGWLP